MVSMPSVNDQSSSMAIVSGSPVIRPNGCTLANCGKAESDEPRVQHVLKEEIAIVPIRLTDA
jgi:hypothetical protein